MRNVDHDIPIMNFLIEAHKENMTQIHINPRNKTTTYGISKVIGDIIPKAIRKTWENIGYIDNNIHDIQKWADEIDNTPINDEL